MDKTANHRKKTKHNSKNNNNCLAVFLALFALTTCLIAQETQEGQTGQQAKKGGWFVGVTPYLLGLSEQKVPVLVFLQVAQWIMALNLALLRKLSR